MSRRPTVSSTLGALLPWTVPLTDHYTVPAILQSTVHTRNVIHHWLNGPVRRH